MKINSSEMKIKEIAFESFANKGYEGTNIRDICKKAGIKPPTLYYYFESKEKLFFSILNETIEIFIKYNTDPEFFKSIMDTEMETEEKLFLIYMRRMKFNENYKKECKFLYRFVLFYPEEFKMEIVDSYSEIEKITNEYYSYVCAELVEKGVMSKDNLNEFISDYKEFIHTNTILNFFYCKETDLLYMKNGWGKFWKHVMN